MILVTGATGTFGGHVANALINKGHKVIVAASTLEKLQKDYADRAELRVFNWQDGSTFNKVLTGVDVVYLVAPPFSSAFDIMVNKFVEVAKQNNVKHIVLTTAYGMDQAEGTSGYNTEQIVKSSGLAYTILRPNFIFQNFINYDLDFIKNGQIFYSAGDGATSYVDIRDVSEVSAEILANPVKYEAAELTITGSEALTHYDMANIFTEVLDRKIEYMNPSEETYKSMLKSYGVPAAVYDFMATLYQGIKAGYMANITSIVQEVTGNEPRSFRSFVDENRELFNSYL